MAPRLASSQLEMIHDMISSKSLTTSEMAEAAGRSKRSMSTFAPIYDYLEMFELLRTLAADHGL